LAVSAAYSGGTYELQVPAAPPVPFSEGHSQGRRRQLFDGLQPAAATAKRIGKLKWARLIANHIA
jgi:hypothetical protein